MNRIDRGILDGLPIAYLGRMVDSGTLRERFVALSPLLDERQRRLFAAAEASAVGYGGSAAVARVAGIGPSTIGRGLRELTGEPQLAPGRGKVPAEGANLRCRRIGVCWRTWLPLVAPGERGDPMSPLPPGLDPGAAPAGA